LDTDPEFRSLTVHYGYHRDYQVTVNSPHMGPLAMHYTRSTPPTRTTSPYARYTPHAFAFLACICGFTLIASVVKTISATIKRVSIDQRTIASITAEAITTNLTTILAPLTPDPPPPVVIPGPPAELDTATLASTIADLVLGLGSPTDPGVVINPPPPGEPTVIPTHPSLTPDPLDHLYPSTDRPASAVIPPGTDLLDFIKGQ
jgi:hypothetical protein